MNPTLQNRSQFKKHSRPNAISQNSFQKDRFIPSRISTFEKEQEINNLSESELESCSEHSQPKIRTYSDVLKLNFSIFSKNDKQKYNEKSRNNSSVQIQDSLKSMLSNYSLKSNRIKFPSEPEKILEIPGLEDDFYTNMLSWSVQNQIALCLANAIFILDNKNGEISQLYEAFDCEQITSLCWNKQGNNLAVGNILGEIVIWDIEKQINISNFECHKKKIGALSWGDQYLLTGSKDKKICISDPRLKIPQIQYYNNHTQEVTGVKWSHNNEYFLTGGNDQKFHVFSIKSNLPLMKGSHESGIKALGWSHQQSGMFFTGGGTNDFKLKIWNLNSKQLIQERDTGSQICSILPLKNSNHVITSHGHPKNDINIWSVNGLKRVAKLKGHSERVLFTEESPLGDSFITASPDETLQFWKIPNFNKKNSIVKTLSKSLLIR